MKQQDPRETLRAAIESFGLPIGARVLLAVSGGADSVAMLRAFAELARAPVPANRANDSAAENLGNAPPRYSLKIGHVNHELRGAESDEDEAFVVALGDHLNIPVEVSRVPIVPGRSAEEERAREGRYRALFAMLRAWHGDFLATAHTADDQAETVLMSLLRGTGSRGLGGIRARSGHLVRPFLSVTHDEINAALDVWGVEFRTDSSNANQRYLRNHIRANVLPLLRRENPAAIRHVSEAAEIRSADADYIEAEAQRLLPLAATRSSIGWCGSGALLRTVHLGLKRQVVRLLLQQSAGIEGDYPTVEGILRSIDEGGAVSLPGGWSFHSEGSGFELLPPKQQVARFQESSLDIPGEAATPAGLLRAEALGSWAQPPDKLIATSGPFVALCDEARTARSLQVRSWEPGDRVELLRGGGTKKLQDIFVDRKIPKELRAQIPVVVKDGHIVWVSGLSLSSEFAATHESERIIRLTLETPNADLRDKMLG